jgi:hypothetical protein
MKQNGFVFLTLIMVMVVISCSLLGCASAPAPTGDSSKVSDVLAGKSFEANYFRPFLKSFFTFNFDGTASNVISNMGIRSNYQEGAYSVSGTAGTAEFTKKFSLTLNSATDPTQIVMDGQTYKKIK